MHNFLLLLIKVTLPYTSESTIKSWLTIFPTFSHSAGCEHKSAFALLRIANTLRLFPIFPAAHPFALPLSFYATFSIFITRSWLTLLCMASYSPRQPGRVQSIVCCQDQERKQGCAREKNEQTTENMFFSTSLL